MGKQVSNIVEQEEENFGSKWNKGRQALNSKWTGVQKWKSTRSLYSYNPRAQERWNLSFNFFFSFSSFFFGNLAQDHWNSGFSWDSISNTWRPISQTDVYLRVWNSQHFALTGLDFSYLIDESFSWKSIL